MESLIDFISEFVAENRDDFEKWKAEREKHESKNVG